MTDSTSDIADQWVTSFHGLQKSSKFVIDDGKVLLVNCPLQLLENINNKDPLGDALLDSLQSFHKKYGCGINSFLCMWCTWNKGIRCLLREGFTFSNILETLTEGLECIINSVKKQEISLQFAVPSLYRFRRNTSADLKETATDCLFDGNYNSMQCQANPFKSITETIELPDKHSHSSMQQNQHLRYSYRLYRDNSFTESSSKWFCDGDSNQRITRVTKCLNVKSSLEDTIVEREISTLLGKISHGSNVLDSLVRDVWRRQLKNNFTDLPSFSKDKILTFPVPGYKFSCSIVVDGIVSKLSSYTSQDLAVNDKSMSHRSLLIGGNLTPNYVHLGFAPDVAIEKISNCVSENDDEIWLHKTVQILHKLKVSALLIQGTVDKRLTSILQGSIIIVSQIPHSSLCKLAKYTCKNIISYIENTDEVNICNVIIEPLQLRKVVEDNEKLLIINIPGKFVCQSVIICHELLYVAHQLEHTFWHFISRLSNICTAKKLLPGRGQTEKFCIRKLQEFSENNYGEDPHKAEALNALSDGFKHYVNKIDIIQAENSIRNDITDEIGESIIYDDPVSKIEGWKAALKLALLLSQVDSVIINGLSEASKDDLFFYHRATI